MADDESLEEIRHYLDVCRVVVRRIKLIQRPSGSGYGSVRLDVRDNRVLVSEATVRDHLPKAQ